MPKIVFLPHHEICPEGAVVEAKKGESICDAALRNGLDIEHACEMSCACTTCHVHIREGFAELPEAWDVCGPCRVQNDVHRLEAQGDCVDARVQHTEVQR